MSVRVGFVGLGRMGHPMCRQILQAGFVLTVFDLESQAIQALVAIGARGADSVSQLAEASDVMLVMVTDDEQVRQVVSQLLTGARPGSVIGVCSSIHPLTCRDLALQGHARGTGLVDVPVAGGIRGAETGTLTVFAGGETADVDRCKPVLQAFSQAIFHMGPVGSGEIAKTCNNLMHWAEVVACYETLTLAKRLGLSPTELRPAILAGSADSRTLRELETIRMTWPEKDMVTALALASESDTPMPLMRRVGELVKDITAADLRAFFE